MLVGLLAGLMMHMPVAGLLAGAAGYLLYLLLQIKRLDQWLSSEPRQPKPDVSGIHSHFVDRIQRLQRQHDLEVQVLRSALDRQNLLISDVRDGVVLLDARGRIQWFNKSAGALVRLSKERDLGVPVRGAIRNAAFHAYLDSEDYRETQRICFDEARKTWLDISVTPYDNQERLLVIRDASLVQQLEEMRRDFIANLSHELRTPVTVLTGYLETLEMQQKDAATLRIMGEMSRQCERISSLLKDLLTLSRLEVATSEPNFYPVDLSLLIPRLASDAAKLREYREQQIQVEIEPGLSLLNTDADMTSVFSNLIGNAVRHTPAKTAIVIKGFKRGEQLIVEVRDFGLGIERHHLGRLTERFYRVESSRNSGTGGTGLGLAIVKHAVLRAGGELNIESELGRGTCFRCIFPLVPTGTEAEINTPVE